MLSTHLEYFIRMNAIKMLVEIITVEERLATELTGPLVTRLIAPVRLLIAKLILVYAEWTR